MRKLYDMYLEEEKAPRIVEIADNKLGFNLDIKNRPANLYLEL